MSKQPDGWVFLNEKNKEIGYAKPSDYFSCEDALHDFGRSSAVHFQIMFRRDGELHSCSDETVNADFYTEAECEERVPSSLYQ